MSSHKQYLPALLLTGSSLMCAPHINAMSDTPSTPALAPNIHDVSVFVGGEGGSSHYRIPSIVRAADDSLVAFAEGRGGVTGGDPGTGNVISIKSRISYDQGKTWSDYKLVHEDQSVAFSDPRPIVDKNSGKIFLFYSQWDKNCAQNNSCIPFGDPKHKLLVKESNDNGLTWSVAKDINPEVKDVNWYANGSDPSSGRATWSVSPSQAALNAAQQNWQLSWNSRVASGSCNAQYFSNGERRYLVDLKVNAQRQVIASLATDGNSIDIPLGFDISAYHDYRIDFNGQSASFFVDGIEKYAGWNGIANNGKTITWGNACSSTIGGSAYHSIEFNANGQNFYQFDAGLIQSVNGAIQGHPADQGWQVTNAVGGKGDPGWKSLNAGPGHGIQLQNQADGMRNGRLIFPAMKMDAFTQLSVVSIYSDDGGQSWQAGQQTPEFDVEPSEADLVELPDGRLLLSARNDGNTGNGYFNRYQYLSNDGGESWQRIDEIQSTTNGAIFFKMDQVDTGLLALGNRILMSGPQGDGAVSSDRNDLAIWSGQLDNNGVPQFNQRTTLRDGYSAYSDLVSLPEQDRIGVIYEAESTKRINFMLLDLVNIK